MKGNVHQALLQDWSNTVELGYGKGKREKLNMRIAAWKTGGFAHPIFQDITQVVERKKWKDRTRQNTAPK